MKNNLNTKAWLGIGFLAIAMGLVLFLPAGTAQYWQAWVFLVVFFGASILITVYLMKKDPALLKRRLRSGPTAEKEKTQKIIMFFTTIGFIALLVVPALDYRFMWSGVPLYMIIVGDLLTALGFYIVFLAYKENTFASATIEVARDQKSNLNGPIRNRAPPHVLRRLALSAWHAACARLVLGTTRAGSHDPNFNVATL